MNDLQLMIYQQDREAHLQRVLKVYATKVNYLIRHIKIDTFEKNFAVDNISRFEKANKIISY